jgi:hypothetical protein
MIRLSSPLPAYTNYLRFAAQKTSSPNTNATPCPLLQKLNPSIWTLKDVQTLYGSIAATRNADACLLGWPALSSSPTSTERQERSNQLAEVKTLPDQSFLAAKVSFVSAFASTEIAPVNNLGVVLLQKAFTIPNRFSLQSALRTDMLEQAFMCFDFALNYLKSNRLSLLEREKLALNHLLAGYLADIGPGKGYQSLQHLWTETTSPLIRAAAKTDFWAIQLNQNEKEQAQQRYPLTNPEKQLFEAEINSATSSLLPVEDGYPALSKNKRMYHFFLLDPLSNQVDSVSNRKQ